MNRRAVLTGLIAAPMALRAETLADVDVAVVGAGAAGIAAGRASAGLGLSAVILEARDRVGGRTHTVGGLGQPFDLGAHWLHGAESNPLVPLARDRNLPLTDDSPEEVGLFADGARRPEADHEAFDIATRRMERRAILPSLFGPERPLAALGRPADPWGALALSIPAIEIAEEPERVSLKDYLALGTGTDLLVRGGFGALIVQLAEGLPIRLSQPVTQIDWQGAAGVTLSGRFGTLRARAAIVTVPTSLLAQGRLRFSPELPSEMQQAIADLPLGVFEKVGFRLSQPRPDLPAYAFATGPVAQGLTHAVHFSPDRQVATVLLTGDTARSLIAAGRDARIATARDLLADVAGSDTRVSATLTTDWHSDPLSLGAYTHRRIGAGGARETYASPLAERLWFAGEAAPGDHAVTVAGAWNSGLTAAKAIARQLKG